MTERPNGGAGAGSADKAAEPDFTQPAGMDEAEVTTTEERDPLADLSAHLAAAQGEASELRDKYLRLHAEFDNFRKRTAKERMDQLLMAGSDTIRNILPVLDDMDRAIAHNAEVSDINAVKQGFELIHQKFTNILSTQGLKAMHSRGEAFNPDLQEAISQVPVEKASLKGKVIDVVEKGYTLNDKVIRFAKVIVGQ